MPSSDADTQPIDAPVGRHFAQFHREHESVVDAVAPYVEAALRRGDGVIAIAFPTLAEPLIERLRHRGLDANAYQQTGQLQLLDSETVLSRITVNGKPDRTAFRQVVEPVLQIAERFGRTTICGDAVDLLWHTGRARDAIEIEEYWNELARLHRFSLFCCYTLNPLDPTSYVDPLGDIGHTHAEILVTREDDRFHDALERAAQETFGVSLPYLVGNAKREERPGEDRLPIAQRTMLWLMRHMPSSAARLLARARAVSME